MLVVITVIVLMAGLVLPRFAGMGRKRAIASVEAAADLLTMFAHRESIGDSNLGLMYDAARRELSIVALQTDDDGERLWIFDPYVQPVVFPEELELLEALQNGQSVGRQDWFVPLSASTERPAIELRFDAMDLAATVFLPANAGSAEILYGDDVSQRPVPIDLDAQGRDREVW